MSEVPVSSACVCLASISQSQNQGVSWDVFLKEGSGEEFVSKIIHTVRQIQLLLL